MADESLESALKLVQEGKTKEAHVLLEQLVDSDIHNITAWLWYAKTAPSTRERTRILEACLRLNPDDADTRRILGLSRSLMPKQLPRHRRQPKTRWLLPRPARLHRIPIQVRVPSL
jgi:hypothetical protein